MWRCIGIVYEKGKKMKRVAFKFVFEPKDKNIEEQ